MFAPLSIPSPPDELQSIPLGDWLRDAGLTWITWPLEIRLYALVILVGIVAAVWLTNRRLTARGAEPGIVLDISLFAVPFGIIGARVFHVLTHPADYFGPGMDLIKTLYIWEGGIAIFGALIGGAVGAAIGCWFTGIRFWTFADAVAPALLLAQAFGRLGNWFNHELYGWPTDLPWGLEIESSNPAYPVGLPDGVLFHPTFLYEIIWNLLGVAVLLWLERKFRPQWGKMLGLYLIWYGAGRVVWETIRVDPSEIFFGIRTNVWAAILAIVVGLAIIAIQSRRHVGVVPSPYRPGKEWVPVVDSVETYSDVPEPGEDAEALSDSTASREAATSGTAATGTGKKS